MLAEISAGLSSLNTAKQIIQGLDSLRTETAINQVKIDLQNLILEAQQGLFAAQQEQAASAERIRTLEKQIMDSESWSAEAERYELADAGQGTVAYRLKSAMNNAQQPHWLCAQCFDGGKKSYLQPETRFPGRYTYLCCQGCKSELITKGAREISQPRPRR